jgi:tetratricopeptide (TPR) repeat protein
MLGCWQRFNEARAQAELAYRLVPGKSIVYRAFGNICYAERDFSNAIKWYRQALKVEPHHASAYGDIGSVLLAQGNYTDALENFETCGLLRTHDQAAVRQRYQLLREALKKGGRRAYWQQEWKLTEAQRDRHFYWKGVIQMHLGNKDEALDWLEKSLAARESHRQTMVTLLLFDDTWEELHSHPRFKALLQKIGFTKVMPAGALRHQRLTR